MNFSRVTRVFWSTKNPTLRCKYTCEIEVPNKQLKLVEVIEKDIQNVAEEDITYCHDVKEWEIWKDGNTCCCETTIKHVTGKGTKRKIGFDKTCQRCLFKPIFMNHKDFLSAKGDPEKIDDLEYKTKTEGGP